MSLGPETRAILSVLSSIADSFKRLIGHPNDLVNYGTAAQAVATDRTVTTTRTKVGVHGTLEALTVELLSGTPRRQTWISATLEDEQQQAKAQLFRGYVDAGSGNLPHGHGALPVKASDFIRYDTYSSVAATVRVRGQIEAGVFKTGGWTGTDESATAGPPAIRAIIGTNPAAAAEIIETVPTGARWELISVNFRFATSSVAADRRANLNVDDGSRELARWLTGVNHTASLAWDYSYTHMGYRTAAAENSQVHVGFAPVPLGAAFRMNTVTGVGLQAGDDYGAPAYIVREHLVP